MRKNIAQREERKRAEREKHCPRGKEIELGETNITQGVEINRAGRERNRWLGGKK